jgi:hypothetical protein
MGGREARCCKRADDMLPGEGIGLVVMPESESPAPGAGRHSLLGGASYLGGSGVPSWPRVRTPSIPTRIQLSPNQDADDGLEATVTPPGVGDLAHGYARARWFERGVVLGPKRASHGR